MRLPLRRQSLVDPLEEALLAKIPLVVMAELLLAKALDLDLELPAHLVAAEALAALALVVVVLLDPVLVVLLLVAVVLDLVGDLPVGAAPVVEEVLEVATLALVAAVQVQVQEALEEEAQPLEEDPLVVPAPAAPGAHQVLEVEAQALKAALEAQAPCLAVAPALPVLLEALALDLLVLVALLVLLDLLVLVQGPGAPEARALVLAARALGEEVLEEALDLAVVQVSPPQHQSQLQRAAALAWSVH